MPLPKRRTDAFYEHQSHKNLINTVEQKLRQPDFFEDLKRHGSFRTKVFKFNDKKYILKDTSGDVGHGYDYHTERKWFLQHQKAILGNPANRPKEYLLRSIKVYGRVGNYLVMEYIEEKKPKDPEKIKRVREEFINRIIELRKQGVAISTAQVEHLIFAGETKDGRAIIYHPIDSS